MPVKRLMIDLETQGLRPTSRILSIGATTGDERFYCEIDTRWYDDRFTTDQSTLDWWTERGGFKATEKRLTPDRAIEDLRNWILRVAPDEVWANSPTFDLAILRHHFEAFDLKCPWEYWAERDVRTLKAFAKETYIETSEYKNPHHALRDAENQLTLVKEIYGEIYVGHQPPPVVIPDEELERNAEKIMAGQARADLERRFGTESMNFSGAEPPGATPKELQALHSVNDLISETLLRLRTLQSHVTTSLAKARDPAPEGDQRTLEMFLSGTNTPYEALSWDDGRNDVVVRSLTFQFDPSGSLVGTRAGGRHESFLEDDD